MQSTTKQVHSIICDWLQSGQEFTADVKEYAETILGVCSFSELEAIFTDMDNPDVEPFFEFILFPDTVLRHTLEPLLTTPFTTLETERLTSLLIEESPSVLIYKDSDSLQLPVPEWMWGDFVSRLYFCNSVVPLLRQSAPEIFKNLPVSVPSCIRASNLPESAATHTALTLFLTSIPRHDPLFSNLLSIWITTLTSLPCMLEYEEATVVQHVETFRRRLYKAIFDAAEFSRKLQRFNMETLMLSGDVPPAINVDEARMQIRLIDRLSIALFTKNVGAIEELEDRTWGDYTDYRNDLPLLPHNEEFRPHP